MYIQIYTITHKKFIKENPDIYVPLFVGADLTEKTYDYLKDNTGENISKQNNIYAELTGEYWAWKNSNSDIIGFCHYRRYFSKNISFSILKEKDIIKYLKNNDIILPQKTILRRTVYETIKRSYNKQKMGSKPEEYSKLKKIIENEYPEYLQSYEHVLSNKECYNNNMFIWLFFILKKMESKINFNEYNKNNQRVLGYLSEVLLTVYVKKHELKIKECYLYVSERKFPLLQVLVRKFPIIADIEEYLISTK